MSRPPCIRHGVRGTCDPRVVEAFEAGTRQAGESLVGRIESMVDFDGQLWTTWNSVTDRESFKAPLDRAWIASGGARGSLHLVRCNDDYDYQEDCMNEAASPSGQAGED